MMVLVATAYPHVVLDEREVPLVAGTTMKVIELVVAQRAYGWSPAELQFQYPYLTMGQIYSALAYYWDHQVALDTDISRRLAFADARRQDSTPAPAIARLQRERRSR
jgi:uncharacterized protein (DUF433 family)